MRLSYNKLHTVLGTIFRVLELDLCCVMGVLCRA